MILWNLPLTTVIEMFSPVRNPDTASKNQLWVKGRREQKYIRKLIDEGERSFKLNQIIKFIFIKWVFLHFKSLDLSFSQQN